MKKTIYITEDNVALLKEYFLQGDISGESYFVFFRGTMYLLKNDKDNTDVLNSLKQAISENGYEKYSLFIDEYSKNLEILTKNLSTLPHIITGFIDGDNLYINHSIFYDITNSPEYKKLLSTGHYKNVMIGTEQGAFDTTIGGDEASERAINAFKPNAVYHGTRLGFVFGILSKGLRPSPINSLYKGGKIQHEDTVFLSTTMSVASAYAARWAYYFNNKFKDLPVVIEFNPDKMDTNKFVVDYDLYNKFGKGVDPTYEKVIDKTGRRDYLEYNKMAKTVDIEKRNPLRYNRVGYRGIVMPSAISKIYVFMDRSTALNIMPDFTFDSADEFMMGLGKIKDALENGMIDESQSPTEGNEYTLTCDGDINGYYHVDGDEKDLNEWVQYNFNNDEIGSISYSVEITPAEEEGEEDYVEFEGSVYDTDGHAMSLFTGDISDINDIFGPEIAQMMQNREGDFRGGEYWLEDLAYKDVQGIDINDVDAVNKAAKRISQPGGDSLFILTDGSIVGFYDHQGISSIDGMTISKFLELGNIRYGNGNSIELMKRPTSEQVLRLKAILRDASNACVDFVKPNRYGNMYPEQVHSVTYKDTYSDRIVNDILNYFDEGIKPLSENKKKTITITEEQADSIKRILTESQESKSIAAAKKLVMQKFNYDEQQADEFVRIKLRNDIPVLRTPQGGKFILGVTRMFCDGELRSANDIGNLNSTLKLVASDAHINEYDRNLNNLSLQELVQRFAKAMSDNLEAERAEISQMAFNTPSDYEIVGIDSFEQAEEYGQYVSWCVTHNESMFDSYTSDGINQFYFCLKHGFENIKPQPSEGCPLDEYGLSMIAVSVNENGMLNTCTCRWNHDNGGDDSIMDAKEVSQVIGMNFFEVFKPNNKWKELISNVMQRLANGEGPNDVFDDCGDFREGFAWVEFNGKWNFINEDCKLLSDQWFDTCCDFHKGFAAVELNGKWNYINQEGRLLSDQWFDDVDDFSEGFAIVELNDKWNFINQEGRLISNQWFDWCVGFFEGFARVKLNGKYNLINQEGRIISNQWFDYVDDFWEGFAKVKLNGKCNFINQEGRFLSDQWFDNCGDFYEGFAKVELNHKCNFINQEGGFLSDQWFDWCGGLYDGFAIVALNGKWNFINQEGRLISDQWFDNTRSFHEGFAEVKLNGKKYRIDTNGNLMPLSENKKTRGKNILTELQKSKLFIFEDKRTDQARARCKEIIRNHFKNADWLDTVFEHQDNPQRMTYLDYMFYHFEEEFYHNPNLRKGATMRLEPLFCKLAFENGFQQQTPNVQNLQRLSAILNLLYNMSINGKINLSKIDIANTTFEQLNNEFGKIIDDANNSEAESINNMVLNKNNDYTVVGPLDYEEAHEIGSYSNPDGELCYTQSMGTWDSYTKNGYNNVYAILKNGWKNIEAVHDDESNSAYDTYGLSMIFVFVDENGELAYCNTRWNHDAKYKEGFSVDHAMSKTDISKLIGANFFEVFKPNNKWKELINNVMQRLANGEDPNDVFDWCGDFREGFAWVELNGQCNFINQEGRFLSDQWFDDCDDFREGFARVKLNDKWNFIDQEGRLISDQWFDGCGGCFYEGFGVVVLNGKRNYINQEGRLLSDQWFDGVDYFREGFAKVKLNDKYNFINQEGRLLSDQWFDDCDDFSEGFARVKLNDKWNFINQEGSFLSDQWFDDCGDFREGFARFILNDKFNLINQEGRLLSNQWFDWCSSMHEGFAGVELNGKRYRIDTNGNLTPLSESKTVNDNLITENAFESWFRNSVNDESEVINENIETELNQSEVRLDSFRVNEHLAPKIWEGFDLNPRVRLKLLDIADDFWKTVDITWVRPVGIKLTGSICNFNWSRYSDIDLHLVVNFKDVDERTEFVQEYFDSKKNEWNSEHDNLKIYGFPVELYVEDINAETSSEGIYDLEGNKWEKKPSGNIKSIGLDKYYIKKIVAKYATKIENLRDAVANTDDDYELRQLGRKADSLWKKIKKMRKFGLERSGESDPFNIAYKCYRRMGYLDMLFDIKSQQYDKLNSITESIANQQDIFALAKERFGTTYDIRECGYILPDGSMLDFSGRHSVTGDSSHLSGRRTIDHREISDLGYDKELKNRTGVKISMEEFIRKGAIRVHVSSKYPLINLFNRPTAEQINVLLRILRYSNGTSELEIGDGDESLSYAEYDKTNPRKVVNDILRYFDEGIKLESNINESYRPLNEFLDKDMGMDLYNYLKYWSKEAGDTEKSEDLVYHCPYAVKEILEKYANENDIEWYDLESEEDLLRFIDYYGLESYVVSLTEDHAYPNDLPTWYYLSLSDEPIVKNEWLIHFSDSADQVFKKGFKFGVECVDTLALTTFMEKNYPGYNFAFRLKNVPHWVLQDYKYGRDFVIFRASGVEAYHKGDVEKQVIFNGETAKDFIYGRYNFDTGKVEVFDQKTGRRLYGDDDVSNVINWIINNVDQYRKRIMRGANGFTESVKQYLKLLKEEVVADGNAEHNVYSQEWKRDREMLKRFLMNNGTVMTSKENGKTYKIYFDQTISNLIGINYCICIQYDQLTGELGNVIYVRALSKFTNRIFQPQFDTRGLDNETGTNDDNFGAF